MYAIDIETMPNEEMKKYLPEVKAKANLKDPVKIEADIKKKSSEQVGKMALSPEFGKIACIGIYGDGMKIVLMDTEKKMLESFFSFLQENKDKKIITHNGKAFDFDFIFKRAFHYGLAKLSDMKKWTDKYKAKDTHIDLMTEYCKYKEYKSLDLLASIYLGEKKIEFDVKTIPQIIKTEEGIKKLKEYCLKDCELTYNLAKKFGYGQ